MILETEDAARAWLAALPEWDRGAQHRLERLVQLLGAENSRQNLIADATIQHVWVRHIADSAQLLRHVPRETAGSWLDLGTGAGFPGLVVAALRPDMQAILVESRGLRCAWLSFAANSLGLANVEVIHARLERIESRRVGVISARAFAPLTRLLDLSARFSTSETRWLLPKGRSAAQELAELKGWDHMFHVEQSLTDSNAGIIVGTLDGRSKGRLR